MLKDWGDMYNDIARATPGKVKILVDMKNVKQCHLNVSYMITMWGRNEPSSKQHDRETDDEDEPLTMRGTTMR